MKLKQFINESIYDSKCFVYHTTTKDNLDLIKKSGKLIPTDHIYFGKLYPNRLHLSTDKRSHIRMIRAIADEKEGYNIDNLFTLVIKIDCYVPEDSDGFDIEYKDLKPDNNAGYDGYSFYIQKSIPLSQVAEILPFKSFINSRKY